MAVLKLTPADQALARALAYAGYEHRFVFGQGWHSRIQVAGA